MYFSNPMYNDWGMSDDLARAFVSGMFGTTMLSFLVFFVIILFGILFGLYILKRLGLYKMCKNAGVPAAGLVFLPIARAYYLGLLAERSVYIYKHKKRRYSIIYLVLNIVIVVLCSLSYLWMGVSAIASALSLVGIVLKFYYLYYIWKDYSPENATLLTILEIVPLATALIMLVYRNTTPVSVLSRAKVETAEVNGNETTEETIEPPTDGMNGNTSEPETLEQE